MGRPSVGPVRKHLREKGAETPAPELADELETIVRNCERAKCLGFQVELSPWMQSLLRATNMETAASQSAGNAAVAGG